MPPTPPAPLPPAVWAELLAQQANTNSLGGWVLAPCIVVYLSEWIFLGVLLKVLKEELPYCEWWERVGLVLAVGLMTVLLLIPLVLAVVFLLRGR
jgi:hypothetical protein